MTPVDESYRELPLSKGMVAKVDQKDFEWLSVWKWSVKATGKPGKEKWYATRGTVKGGNRLDIPMHREIMGLKKGDELLVDHINGDTLDNRRCNLRLATHSQNSANRKMRDDHAYGLRSVFWDPRLRRWWSVVVRLGKTCRMGPFDDIEDAAVACNAKLLEWYGEYARLSTPEQIQRKKREHEVLMETEMRFSEMFHRARVRLNMRGKWTLTMENLSESDVERVAAVLAGSDYR